MIVSNLTVTIHNTVVLKDISFVLNKKDKVGLVGINGSGKSTLLKALSSNIEIDSGNINSENSKIGYLKQEISHTYDNYSIIDYIKEDIGLKKLEEKIHYLENNLNENNTNEYGEVLDKYLSLDGYNFENNLKVITNGLNLKENLNTKLSELSGGEKIKVLISNLLLERSDILLLDEPTNNIDSEAIKWLESYLKKVNKSMIIVSHDELFLNDIVDKIYELDNTKLTEYNMSYSEYLAKKESEYKKEKEEYTKVKEEKEKLKREIQRAKEWANLGTNKKAHNDNDKIANNYAKEKTNSSNVSKLSKALNDIEVPDFEEKKYLDVFLNLDASKGNKDIILDNLVCGYPNFKTPKVNIRIPFGRILKITGSNGTGKTTLIKTILDEIKPIEGKVIKGSSVKVGYISQDTMTTNNETIYEYLTKNETDEVLLFTLLDKFGISYDKKDKKYNSLSPGERTRVNLVKIALDKINVLILDEVTNHLDKEALDLIYDLINNYKGTIISISHNKKYNEYLKEDIILDIETGTITKNNLVS